MANCYSALPNCWPWIRAAGLMKRVRRAFHLMEPVQTLEILVGTEGILSFIYMRVVGR